MLQPLIPLVTWFVVKLTADVNYFGLISLDIHQVSQENVLLFFNRELSVKVVDNLLLG